MTIDKEKIICPQCNGEGVVDSGGSTFWGAEIDIGCPCCEGKGVVSEEELEKMGAKKE